MLRDMYADGTKIEACLKEYDLPESMLDLIVVIYGLARHDFDGDAYNLVVNALRNKCDYSLMTSNTACMYGALLIVLYEDPLNKISHMIELVNVFRGTGFRSRVSNLMALGLLDESMEPEDRSTETLKLYHEIHRKHGFITGEDDYLAVMHLAGMKRPIETQIQAVESYYHQLAALSFNKGNALQALSHQLALFASEDQTALVHELDKWCRRFKKDRIKINGSQILLFGLLGALGLDEEVFMSGLLQRMEKARSYNPDSRVHALQRSAIILEEIHHCIEVEEGVLNPVMKAYIKASMFQLLSSYLFRERLL